jgi:hypothetical protein
VRYQSLVRAYVALALSACTTGAACAQSPWQGAAATTSPTKSAALKWELGYLALSAIDTAQTIDCLNRELCVEGNPILGKHPSSLKLIAGKVGLGLLHFTAFSRINDKNPRGALRVAQISCALQGTVVGLNARFTFN